MKQFKCSMAKKIESLTKNEGYEISSYHGGQPSIWIYGDDPVIGDDLTIDVVNGNYDFGELKLKPGETILNVTDEEDLDDLLENELAGVIKLVDWVPGDSRNGSNKYPLVKVLVKEAKKPESKTSEGISDMIDAQIDYNMFMRMCKTAAYLEEDEDYWDALWDFYSEVGSIGDALVFFDNLFQYTAWKDVDETYDELDESDQDGSKSKEECIEAVLDSDGEICGSLVRKYGDHYLWVY